MSEPRYTFEKIMLVDDNKINNIINKKLFELTSFSREIVIATNGEEAIDYLKMHADHAFNIPQIIFLDVYMPLMDGIGFLHEFVKLPQGVLNRSRIVMLSSTLDPDDHQKVHSSPYVIKFLEKPLNIQKVKETDLIDIREAYFQQLQQPTHRFN